MIAGYFTCMDLLPIIKQQIHDNGPISFRDYMEIALYYPDLGYYMAPREKIGIDGDYYTSCCLGPVFGAMVAKQIDEMWRLSGEDEFTIVEFGAGDGRLCHDILDYFYSHTKYYTRLHYVIIEKSPFMRHREKAHLAGKVCWCDNLQALGEFTGCVISNELVDNFAVHRVVMQEELLEVFVDDNNGLVEVLRPAGMQLKAYFKDLGVELPYGYCTEVNLQARRWLADVALYLRKGYVLTIDYGYLSDELYRPCRSAGTLLCYLQHQLSEQFYQQPGSRDITAHVNFSALRRWGEQFGLSYCGLTSQAAFLLALDCKGYLRQHALTTGDVVRLAMEEARITRTLLVDMGMKFKVLVQQKAMGAKELTGLKPF